MVCNFPNDEIPSFIDSITNIQSSFRPILERYWSNLRNSKQYSAKKFRKNLDLKVEDNSYREPDRTMKTYQAFSLAQSEFPRTV